ncbi:hypothetical protein BD769DRAFT_1291985, partial [Suillus cothurnatus]
VARLMKDWSSPIYAFFKPRPAIEYHDKHRCYVFKYAAHGCKHHIRQYLDKKDAKSTGNITTAARDGPIKSLLENRSIKTSFEQKGKGKVTYSHCQHTCAETRFMVNDQGFQNLMKTGRPEYYLPSLSTVTRDVKQVFVKTQKHILNMLQNYEGKLNFATHAWTSPNHRAYVALSVHLEHEGQGLAMILDIIEVAKTHTGADLAEAF